MSRLRVATLNTWKNEGAYRRRLELIASGLAALDLDIICLQECFAAPSAHTAREVACALGYNWAFLPARRKSRVFEGRETDSVSGLAVLTRFHLRAADALALPGHPLDPDRSAQIVDLDHKRGTLRVVNLHLTHVRDALGEEVRTAQIESVLAAALGDSPVLIAGDFNALPSHAPVQRVLTKPGADGGPEPPEAWAESFAGLAIDHVLLIDASGAWRVTARRSALHGPDVTDDVAPSDHGAIIVDLEQRA